MRLFTFCTYLKTKESYDRWVTRRLWGFRQQISKAKYLKTSVGNIRKLQENTAAQYTERKTLWVSVIRKSGYVYPEKLKRLPLPSDCDISGWKMSAHGSHPDVKCRRTDCPPCVQGVGTPFPGDTERARLSGSTPSGFTKRDMWLSPIRTPSRKSTRHSWTSHSDDSISYLDMLSGSLFRRHPVRTSFTPCIPDLLMAKDFKASVLHVSELSIALPWIPKNSPQSLIALVIKKLSKHQNLTQFD